MPTKKKTGKLPESDKMYCEKCGAVMSKEAIMCPECGAPTKNYQPVAGTVKTTNSEYQAMVGNRDKVVAIVLAVFFGLWVWLYTYKVDGVKFWVNLVLSICTLGIWGVVAWIWAIVEAACRTNSFYLNYPNES